MHKHPLQYSLRLSASQPFAGGAALILLSPRAFQRFLRGAVVYHQPSPLFQVFALPCGCFLWVHYTGLRFVSGLPF